MRTGIIALVVAAFASGCGSTPRQPSSESAPVTVIVSHASVADLAQPFEAGGVVKARATAFVASRVMAPITDVLVRPGDRVRRGATLVRLDARGIEANKLTAEAQSRSAAEAALAADADVRAADSALGLARATHDRVEGLHAKRSATAQEMDQAIAALSAAEAQRTSAQARLAAANAAHDAARASADAASVTATYAELSAPFDGVITERHADPGSMAVPGTALLALEDPATYRLEVQLDEARVGTAAIGQTVPVRFDNTPPHDDSMKGRIAEIARVDPVSHAFLVKIDLPPSAAMRSGLFGRAQFSGASQRTLVVPASALIRRGQLAFVYVVGDDGRAHLRPVSTGMSQPDRVEVLAGLRDGDAVVADPPPALSDGARITGARP